MKRSPQRSLNKQVKAVKPYKGFHGFGLIHNSIAFFTL